MRDRLSHLHALSQSNGRVEELESAAAYLPSHNTHGEAPQQDSNDPEIEAVFDEANGIRRDVQLIILDVKHLKEQNARIYTELPNSTPTAVQQDSSAIAAKIKASAEDLLVRLRKMDEHAKELENQHGANAAVSRIARTQYAGLSSSFREAMLTYNQAEMSHRETCKQHIQRQLEIVGQQVTSEQIEEMLENGQWNVFSVNMLSEGKTARSALNQIESRHRDLLELEKRIKGIHELFLDVAMLVEEQSSMIDYIQTNVQNTDAALKGVLMKLERAKRHDRSNPFKKIFFWRR
ncbi:syntaxin-11-like [Colossoma macropomum]|uniref:syntaxin-11-like n=1 Tax=Colossoma macropomum TaxID=42526 RepID=UPI001863D7D4|nr:syntaxin-11-like [Colossoma macropomum]